MSDMAGWALYILVVFSLFRGCAIEVVVDGKPMHVEIHRAVADPEEKEEEDNE